MKRYRKERTVKQTVLAATLAVLSVCLPAHAGELGEAVCGSLQNHFGPYDYRTVDPKTLDLVERHHFTSEVERLQRGKTATLPGHDLSYTLNVFPNHHRALMAMMRYALREQRSLPRGATRTIECWFDRAQRYAPNDAMPKVIQGLYLAGKGQDADAEAKLREALALDPADPNVHYNLGLAWMDLRRYDLALDSAHRAYAAGHPLPGLRLRLERAGHWRELQTNAGGEHER